LLYLLFNETKGYGALNSGSSPKRLDDATVHNMLKRLKHVGDSRLTLPLVKQYISVENISQTELTLLVQVLGQAGQPAHAEEALRIYLQAEALAGASLVGAVPLTALLKTLR
jgi:hypothetical protein